MPEFFPESPAELRDALADCASKKHIVEVVGLGSKINMGGYVESAAATITTRRLNKVLMYEPRDLTVSVEAGYPFAKLQQLLAENGQMIALDPPFSDSASVGGIVAANHSGPLRSMYGTARDVVIGMRFVNLDGKIVDTGGMVVKNVAGLDMGKLMIGSLGTLAVISSVNFRLHSLPEATETFLYAEPELNDLLVHRNRVKNSVLQPIAADILSPAVAYRLGQRAHILAIRVAGREDLLARYRSEFPDTQRLSGYEEHSFWTAVQEFTPTFLEEQPDGVIARVSTTLSGMAALPNTVAGSFIARAFTGVSYFHFGSWTAAAPWWKKIEETGLPAAIEFAPANVRQTESLWSGGKTDNAIRAFAMMKRVKAMFDPQHLLNPGRLYGRI